MLRFSKHIRSANRARSFPRQSLPIYVWRPKEEVYRNFGDEITPLLATRIAELHGISIQTRVATPGESKLLGVGSVLHQAKGGDVIWGSGVNGKNWPRALSEIQDLDVRSVRGPLTWRVLSSFGITAPEIYGDPGLLFPELFKNEIESERGDVVRQFGELEVIFIPNLNDERFLPAHHPGVTTISPSESPFRIAQIISRSKLVLSSSLHGIVFADAMGVPCRPILSAFEPALKYWDYFAGTGRPDQRFAENLNVALSEFGDLPPAIWDRDALLRSFPIDLIT